MNDNMDAAPRDGRFLLLRLADGDQARGRFDAQPGCMGLWVGVDGRVLIPRPVAWSQATE